VAFQTLPHFKVNIY